MQAGPAGTQEGGLTGLEAFLLQSSKHPRHAGPASQGSNEELIVDISLVLPHQLVEREQTRKCW